MSAPFDLSVTRLIDAPPATVYRTWIDRQEEWFAPKPWSTRIIARDLRAGGRSALVMKGPDGTETSVMEGVFLEVVPNERIVFTDAFAAGWVPQEAFMIGIHEFAEEAGRTRFTATARHWTQAACDQHREMGFDQGWGTMAAQLAALAEEGRNGVPRSG